VVISVVVGNVVVGRVGDAVDDAALVVFSGLLELSLQYPLSIPVTVNVP